ncbi:MAG: hypothetical protein II317_00170 [Clostridia bacterium]|nr:hypothetical protein [Clostridia bacterium]
MKRKQMNIARKAIGVFMLLFIMLATFLPILSASAVSYTGKGTKKDPYIVTTPEQLNGIREKMNAHYKLGANIDMKEFGNFVSIGTPANKFTGSFVCDTDKKGVPLYAITNLKIHLNATGCTHAENFSGFKKDGSMGWMVGLFGSAEGASFENIVLLDVDVYSNVQGLYGMNSDWTVNPVAHQSTGSLLGGGREVNIVGCGVTGKLVSASNSVGGLVGSLASGKIKNSYSYVDVTCTGTWGSGGLAGAIEEDVTVDSCFYKGTFSGGVTHAGAFIGGLAEKTVTNCWADGIVKTETSGCFGGTDVHGGGTQPEIVKATSNCYTLCKIEGRKKAQTNKRVTNNNYITNEPGGLQVGFAAADMATINAAFKGLNAWVVTDGDYPQLKNVHPVTKLSELGVVDEKVTIDQSNGTTNQSNGITDTNQGVGENTEINSEIEQDNSTYTVKTDINNTVATLSMKDTVLIIIVATLLLITFIFAVITVVFVIRSNVKAKKTDV